MKIKIIMLFEVEVDNIQIQTYIYQCLQDTTVIVAWNKCIHSMFVGCVENVNKK